MKVLGVVLLSVCVIAKAEQGGSLSRSLGDTGYHVIFQAPNSAVTADDVAALYHTFSAQERFVIAGQIEAALENFRDVIINGNALLPVLDPFTVDLIGPYQFNAAGVGAQGSISNLRVEGLRWYLVDRVTFNALRMTFGGQITVPWIITTGSYDAQARVAILNHRAGGNFRLFLSRLVMSVDARLGTNIIGGGHLFLRELAIKIDIHDTYIQIDGMVGSSWLNALINSFVQSITQQVIQEHMETLSTVLSEQLFDIINALLKGLSL